MTGSLEVRFPMVLWAQRKDCVYLTISVEDCKDADLKIDGDKVAFKGTGGDKVKYAVTIETKGKLNSAESKYVVRDRNIELLLKKDGDGYWSRLLKDSTKVHWLKVDFNKWKDEDESEDEVKGTFEDMMRQMGGMGGGGMEGLGGMGGGMDDFEPEEDSDDEGLPDLEPTKDNKEEERKE